MLKVVTKKFYDTFLKTIFGIHGDYSKNYSMHKIKLLPIILERPMDMADLR